MKGGATLSVSAGGWLRLKTSEADELDISQYRYVAFAIRGVDGSPGFTNRIVLELRNRNEVSRVIVNGITNTWNEFKIPISQFTGITNRSEMTEIILLVDAQTASAPNGVLLIDDFKLIK